MALRSAQAAYAVAPQVPQSLAYFSSLEVDALGGGMCFVPSLPEPLTSFVPVNSSFFQHVGCTLPTSR